MAQAKNVAQGSWVTVIDSRPLSTAKLRVATYARVSSDSEDQINSYIAQVDYYTKHIASKEEWEMVDVYADEGLTGMETRRRDEFNRMVADCRDGKIDRILVKSISRFARNQEDYIYYMRELMRLGVTIHFEKENIDTGKMTSEQAAAIYGAFAQMETTGHSQNMRVSYRMRIEKGMFIPSSAPFGFRLTDNRLVIEQAEAEVIRRIYDMYLNGQGVADIAKELNRRGIKSRAASGTWYQESVRYILTNVTYTGDQLWQKKYSTDVLPFKKLRNKGEKPKYFAENCGPAIISKQDFQLVQSVMADRRDGIREGQTNQSPLHKHLYCAECGCLCRRKMCRGKPYWMCRRRDREKADCDVSQASEADILNATLRFYGRLQAGRDTVLRPMLAQLEELRE